MSLDRLPEAARSKYLALEQASADAKALIATIIARCDKATTKLLVLQQQHQHYQQHPTAPGAERAAELAAALAQAEAELKMLTQQREERSDRHATCAQIVAQLQGWLRDLPAGTVLEAVTVEAPKLRHGNNIAAAVARVRSEIQAAQSELGMIRFAPPTPAEVEHKVRDYVERLRRSGSPVVTATHERFAISFFGAQPDLPAPTLGPQQIASMFAWLDPQQLTERLLATYTATPTAGEAVSFADGTRRIAALALTLEELERREESLIVQAANNGLEIQRRPHANPITILGVQAVSSRAAAVAAA